MILGCSRKTMNRKIYCLIGIVLLLVSIKTRVFAKYVKFEKTKIADINVEKTFYVTINYIDRKSNTLLENESIEKLKKGDEYNCTQKEIEGYYLDSDSNNTYGTIQNENIEVNYYYKPNGVFAKCYDTSGNGKVDTLVLNKNPKFTYNGTLINDFENQDNNDYQQNSDNNIPIWHSILNQVEEVVVLNNIIPLNYTTRWFEYGNNIEKIDGLERILTYKVKDVSRMFKYCEKMKTIDLSNMDTSNVENMCGLFYRCYQLESINLNNIDTSKVINMDIMFTNCEKLAKLDLSSFNTKNVIQMESMFCNCDNLTEIKLVSFNTKKVKTMLDMFSGCGKLKILNLSSFDTNNVGIMYGMFYRCSELRTILIGEKWNTNNVTNSRIMFSGDYKLSGGKGTTYNGNYVDKRYAHNDEGSINPGYLTMRKSNNKSNNEICKDEKNEEKVNNNTIKNENLENEMNYYTNSYIANSITDSNIINDEKNIINNINYVDNIEKNDIIYNNELKSE